MMSLRLDDCGWVFLGGGLGALSRHLLLLLPWFHSKGSAQEALGVLTVNSLGCLLLGILTCLIIQKPQLTSLRPAVAVGFLGGFTTYSSFQLCWLKLAAGPDQAVWPMALTTPSLWALWLGYPLLSLVSGWAGFGLGYFLAQSILSPSR